MSNTEISKKKGFSPDWFVRGVLIRLGDMFDGLTGRKWTPSSSIATSELIERLKKLLDAEARDLGAKGKVVPHNLKLKMQWDKFSTDENQSIKKLENELLIAAVDHINDNRYQTYAPLKLEILTDYFTDGVKLQASYDNFDSEQHQGELNVTVPEIKVGDYGVVPEVIVEPNQNIYSAEFTTNGRNQRAELAISEGKRLNVGRSRENSLCIEDQSVSKIHAVLMMNSEGILEVADTGSTNGTFVNNERIAYGKAVALNDSDKLRFGTVEVTMKNLTPVSEPERVENEVPETESFTVDAVTNSKNTSAVQD